jgi:hypothetical protein
MAFWSHGSLALDLMICSSASTGHQWFIMMVISLFCRYFFHGNKMK